jgi:hypothetical protein
VEAQRRCKVFSYLVVFALHVTALGQRNFRLIKTIYQSLDNLKIDPYEEEYPHKAEALKHYNLLRALEGLKPALSFELIDNVWLFKRYAPIIQQPLIKRWEKRGYTKKAEKIAFLLFEIDRGDHELDQAEEFEKEPLKRQMLGIYNLLMGLINKPEITSSQDINWSLLQEVHVQGMREAPQKIKDLATQLGIGEIVPGARSAPFEQEEILKSAQQLIGLKEPIIALRHPQEVQNGSAFKVDGKSYIALSMEPDLDNLLFTIFHELGHIVHNDSEMKDLFQDKAITLDKLFQSTYKDDIDRVKKYLSLGKKVFNSQTKIGREILKILERKPSLWEAPADNKRYELMVLSRTQEKNADLFALDVLFELNRTATILNAIDFHGVYPVTADAKSTHPSDFERTLYIAGFLADKKISVNAALKDWIEHGICVPVSAANTLVVGESYE